MTIIIANIEGVWADRHTENNRATHLAGYHAKKIHAISDDCAYTCTGSVVKPEHYDLIYRNFKDAILNGVPFRLIEGQDSDLQVFVHNGNVYFNKHGSSKIEMIVEPDDTIIGGAVTDLAYLLHLDGLDPSKIISYASAVSNTVSAQHDCVYARVK